MTAPNIPHDHNNLQHYIKRQKNKNELSGKTVRLTNFQKHTNYFKL